jgi:septum formation protein
LQLLAQWGVACVALLPDADEDAEGLEIVRPNEAPRAYVQRVTRLKAQAALARAARRGFAPGLVLCADTTVALGRRILGKPHDAAEASTMLQALSGRTHRVMTAVAVARWDGSVVDGPVQLGLSTSQVRMRALQAHEIEAYVASGEPMGKAGAYGIQGTAALWVSHLSGSYTGIMGLPAYETGQVLAQVGLDVWQAMA